MPGKTISARLDPEAKEALDKLASATNRSRSFLVSEAIHQYVEAQMWQVEAIKEAVIEADKGLFASDSDVEQFFSKWEENEN